jgi:dolichyl-phosphate beta-glucosyltransferase
MLLSNHKLEFSVVLPSYNEAATLPKTLNNLSSFLEKLNKKYEIIVSDDGSTDSTFSLDWTNYHNQFRVKYIRNEKKAGKGAALRQGLLACCGRYIFFTDADLPIDLEALARGLFLLENNETDIVIGDRKLPESKAVGSAHQSRFIASMLFNIGVQLLFLPGYTDTQCPMKGFTKEALTKVLLASFLISYAFDAELLYLATLYGMRIKRIPVFWKDVRGYIPLIRLTYIVVSCLKDLILVRFTI